MGERERTYAYVGIFQRVHGCAPPRPSSTLKCGLGAGAAAAAAAAEQ